MEINMDNIYSPDNTSFSGEAYKKSDGYTHFKELGPDFFRAPDNSPQVQVLVNDYPGLFTFLFTFFVYIFTDFVYFFLAWCSADDCSYTYDSSIEATVVSIASTSDGLGNVDVTITGYFVYIYSTICLHIFFISCLFTLYRYGFYY